MGPRDECQSVVVVKRLRDVLPERISSAPRRDSPAATVVRVGPEKIAHGPFVRHFLDAVNRTDVVQRVDRRGKSTVKAEDLTREKS
jgi:hypothetical protein